MLWKLVTLIFVLWLLGMATSYTLGGVLHILAVLAVAAILLRLIEADRNPV